MTRILAWLDGQQHKARYGHYPAYYDVGSGLIGGFMQKVCVRCLRGGRRVPRYRWIAGRA